MNWHARWSRRWKLSRIPGLESPPRIPQTRFLRTAIVTLEESEQRVARCVALCNSARIIRARVRSHRPSPSSSSSLTQFPLGSLVMDLSLRDASRFSILSTSLLLSTRIPIARPSMLPISATTTTRRRMKPVPRPPYLRHAVTFRRDNCSVSPFSCFARRVGRDVAFRVADTRAAHWRTRRGAVAVAVTMSRQRREVAYMIQPEPRRAARWPCPSTVISTARGTTF